MKAWNSLLDCKETVTICYWKGNDSHSGYAGSVPNVGCKRGSTSLLQIQISFGDFVLLHAEKRVKMPEHPFTSNVNKCYCPRFYSSQPPYF
jgi:hypothetical protein